MSILKDFGLTYQPYDIPFFEEALDFCGTQESAYLSPIHLLKAIFKYTPFRHFLKVHFDISEFNLFKLDLFIDEYIEGLRRPGIDYTKIECTNGAIEGVPCWTLDRLSVYYEDYLNNFKRITEDGSFPISFGLLLSCIVNTNLEKELDPIFEEVFGCSYKRVGARVTLEEEVLEQPLLYIKAEQYTEVCFLRHFVFQDKDLISKLDMDYKYSWLPDKSLLEFKKLDGESFYINTQHVAQVLGYFSVVETGLAVLSQDNSRHDIATNLLPSILSGAYNPDFPPIVSPIFANEWYGFKMGEISFEDNCYYTYQFTGEEWCKFFEVARIGEEYIEEYLTQISKLYDGPYGPITLLETLNGVSPRDRDDRVISKAPPMEATVERDTAKNKSLEAPKKVTRSYKFGDYVPTLEHVEEVLQSHIPNRDYYMQSAYIGINRQMKRSTMFIGPSGCGKTQFLSYMMIKNNLGDYPYLFDKKVQFVAVDVGAIMNAYSSLAEFSNGIRNLFSKYDKKGNETQTQHVFVMDNFSRIATLARGGISIEVLCSASSSYNIPIIGACTDDEFTKSLKTSTDFGKSFEVVKFKELIQEEALKVLRKKKESYEDKYKLVIPDSVCVEAVRYSERFIRNEAFPGKALVLLDKLCGISLLNSEYLSEDYASFYRSSNNSKDIEVSTEIIGAIMQTDYNIPATQLEGNKLKSIKELDKNLKSHVFGQEKAIEQFIRYWKKHQAGMVPKNKTIGSFLFIGPTGVGKTELARQIAEFTGRKLLRFDMSEYAESYNTSKLLGSPSGYVGCDDGGLLTNAVAGNPNCVLLLDEIEKAHPSIHNVLLQAMDNAELTSSRGEKVDFQNVIIIMTSNCGAREASETKSLGFNSTAVDKSGVYDRELRNNFTPEFIGRFDGIIHFNELSDETNRKIIQYQFEEICNRAIEQYVNIASIKGSKAFFDSILTDIKENKSGARGIAHALDTKVTERLCDILLDIGETRGMIGDGSSKTMYHILISLTKAGTVSFKLQKR